MINNRWLVELFKERLFGNESVKTNSYNWLDEIDNAASWTGYWNGPGHWQDTHIYSWKQWHERALEAYRKQEERHKKWLEEREQDEC